MIDEEDDEDILEKGISLKSVLKNLLIMFLIILGAMIIYLGTGTDQITNFMVGFMLICVASTLIQVQKQPPEPIRQTLTILICGLCNLTKVRNYEAGDFVFKKVEKCEKCNNSMQVKQIYSVRLKQPTEENKPKSEEKKEETSPIAK